MLAVLTVAGCGEPDLHDGGTDLFGIAVADGRVLWRVPEPA